MIGARTRLVGLLGHPVAHSLSPAMQAAGFAALGLDWAYAAFDVPPEALADAVRGAAALGFVGLNVTIPHKEAALGLCAPDAIARRVGAVNTIVFDGAAHGTNTDVHGVAMLLAEAGVDPRGRRAAILGAGGAARAAAVALTDGGARVTVVSRSGRALVLDGKPLPAARWDDLPRVLAATDLLVDATPRGLDPSQPPIDLAPLPASAFVADLAVRPTTRLVDDARARGLGAAGGAAMLLHQGAAALAIWSGRPAPVEPMRAALAAALANR